MLFRPTSTRAKKTPPSRTRRWLIFRALVSAWGSFFPRPKQILRTSWEPLWPEISISFAPGPILRIGPRTTISVRAYSMRKLHSWISGLMRGGMTSCATLPEKFRDPTHGGPSAVRHLPMTPVGVSITSSQHPRWRRRQHLLRLVARPPTRSGGATTPRFR